MGSDNLTKCHLGLQSATHYYPLKSGTPPIIQTVNYFSVRQALIPSDFRTRICHLDLFYMRNLMPVGFEWFKMSFWVPKEKGSAMSFGLWFSENRIWGVVFISSPIVFPDWNEFYLQLLLDSEICILTTPSGKRKLFLASRTIPREKLSLLQWYQTMYKQVLSSSNCN